MHILIFEYSAKKSRINWVEYIRFLISTEYEYRIYSGSWKSIFVFEYKIFVHKYSNIRIYSNIRHTLAWARCATLWSCILWNKEKIPRSLSIIFGSPSQPQSYVFRWWSHLHTSLCVSVCLWHKKIGFETKTWNSSLELHETVHTVQYCTLAQL